jgi:hypothetical protein
MRRGQTVGAKVADYLTDLARRRRAIPKLGPRAPDPRRRNPRPSPAGMDRARPASNASPKG